MRKFFGYVRVSTVKQGEHGVSLQEQRDAISRHASKSNLEVTDWFEERETAAKRGRPIFNQMLSLLRIGRAEGVVIHKIDRSARNLKDWADLGELIDRGVEVHFANEAVDLHSRGGRLSADIQAVVAADFIRNLREETRKGFYGRIKQGLYPLPAPLGYLDAGGGQLKRLDPVKAPLVRKAFELYGTGRYNLDLLRDELHHCGLRNRRGGRLSRNGLSILLNNPFYIGLIRLRRTSETFPGGHEPLIAKSLFDRVRQILSGKVPVRIQRHEMLFRRMFSCGSCRYALVGEKRKGHVYYRCHTKECGPVCVREEAVENTVIKRLLALQFNEKERESLGQQIPRIKTDWTATREAQLQALLLRRDQARDRLARLTDAFLDGVIDKDLFEERKSALLLERKESEESLDGAKGEQGALPDNAVKFLELIGSPYLLYKQALPEEKRDLLKIVTSDRQVSGKNIELTLVPPFDEVAKRLENTYSSPYRYRPRTFRHFIIKVMDWMSANPGAAEAVLSLAKHTSHGDAVKAGERAA